MDPGIGLMRPHGTPARPESALNKIHPIRMLIGLRLQIRLQVLRILEGAAQDLPFPLANYK